MTLSPKPWERNWDAAPAGGKPWERDWSDSTTPEPPTAPDPGLGQQLLDVGKNTLSDVGSAVYGASATANKLFANIARMAGSVIPDTAGPSAPLRILEQTFRQNQEAQQKEAARLAGGRTDLAGQINRGLTQGILELPQYAIAAHLAGPAAGMAAVGAISEADKGWRAALQAAAEGALTGGALQVMGPASRPVRLTAAAAMTYAQARLNGADNETALAHATTMGLMAGHAPGGVTAREFVPGLDTAVRTAGRAAEVARAGPKAAAGAVVNVVGGIDPALREAVGVISPRAKHVLDVAARVKKARDAYTAAKTAAAEAAAPVAETPGMVLARESGADWADLSAADQAMLETVAKAKANAAAQPAARPAPQTPPPAPSPEPPPATAAPPQTAAESRALSFSRDERLALRFLGENDPLSADPWTIGLAHKLIIEKPELLTRLRAAAAPEPPVLAVGTLEYNAPGVTPRPPEEPPAPAPAPAPTPPPQTPPAAGRANAAEIASQLEESMRTETLTDFLVRNKVPAAMIDQFEPQHWQTVADQAGVRPPTPEQAQVIRANLAEYEGATGTTAKEPAAAVAEFEQKKAVRTKRQPKAAAAEPDLEGQLAESVAKAQAGERPVAPPPAEGPRKATAPEKRIEAVAKAVADDQRVQLSQIEDPAVQSDFFDRVARGQGLNAPAPGEPAKIMARIRELRGEGPPATEVKPTLRTMMEPSAPKPKRRARRAAPER